MRRQRRHRFPPRHDLSQAVEVIHHRPIYRAPGTCRYRAPRSGTSGIVQNGPGTARSGAASPSSGGMPDLPRGPKAKSGVPHWSGRTQPEPAMRGRSRQQGSATPGARDNRRRCEVSGAGRWRAQLILFEHANASMSAERLPHAPVEHDAAPTVTVMLMPGVVWYRRMSAEPALLV